MTILKQGGSANCSGRDHGGPGGFDSKMGKTAFDRECSASESVCTRKEKKMFLHKFGLNQASLSNPVPVTHANHLQYFITLHSAHGEHFWFASHVQFNLNNLLSEQTVGVLYCSE